MKKCLPPLPQLGIEPKPPGLKSGTLPRRCKSWLIQRCCTSFDKLRSTTYSSSIFKFVPESQQTFILNSPSNGLFVGRQMLQVEKCLPPNLPQLGIELKPPGLKSGTLPRRCKSWLIQLRCTSFDKLRSTTCLKKKFTCLYKELSLKPSYHSV